MLSKFLETKGLNWTKISFKLEFMSSMYHHSKILFKVYILQLTRSKLTQSMKKKRFGARIYRNFLEPIEKKEMMK